MYSSKTWLLLTIINNNAPNICQQTQYKSAVEVYKNKCYVNPVDGGCSLKI